MNKKLLLTFILSGAGVISYAQAPTLTAANMSPVLNDSFVTVNCDTTGVAPGLSGATQTWNFGSLTPTFSVNPIDTGHVVYPAAGTGYSILSAIPGFAATVAIVSPATSLTTYDLETSTKLSTSGIFTDVQNNAVYTDPLDVLQFPFTFGTTFSDTYGGVLTVLGSTLTVNGTVRVTGDGWGTLILPPVPPSSTVTTYTGVLRAYSFQPYVDSSHLFTGPLHDTIETYTWYQPGYHTALLTIATLKSGVVLGKSVVYAQKQIANHEAVASVNLDASLKVFPNPANGLLNLQFTNNTGSKIRISLVDMLGKQIAVVADQLPAGYNQVSYNTSSVARGMYLVRLQSGTETVTRKIEIQ